MRLVVPACLAAVLLSAAPAFAQQAPRADNFSRGFGMDNDSWDDPTSAGTQGDNQPHVIVDGRLLTETTLFGGLTDSGSGSSLNSVVTNLRQNVVTQGDWNTALISSDQVTSNTASQGAQ